MSAVEIYSRYQASIDSLRNERHNSQRILLHNNHLEEQIKQYQSVITHERSEMDCIKQKNSELLNRSILAESKYMHIFYSILLRLHDLDVEIVAMKNELQASQLLEKRLKQECTDLAKQVRQLLYKDIEEAV